MTNERVWAIYGSKTEGFHYAPVGTDEVEAFKTKNNVVAWAKTNEEAFWKCQEIEAEYVMYVLVANSYTKSNLNVDFVTPRGFYPWCNNIVELFENATSVVLTDEIYSTREAAEQAADKESVWEKATILMKRKTA